MVGRLLGVWRRPARLDLVIVICIPAVITSIIQYGLYYYLDTAWQLLAMAAAGVVALASLGLSLIVYRRRKLVAAAWLVVTSLLIVFGVVPLLVDGLTPYIIIAVWLLVLMIGAEIFPNRRRAWLVAMAAFAVLAWLADRLAPLPRYATSPSEFSGLYLLGTNAMFVFIILWHRILAALQAFTSIRARLPMTALLLVLFTGGAISYFSIIVMLREEQNDAIARLNAVTMRQERQIDIWRDDMRQSLALSARRLAPRLRALLAAGAPNLNSYRDARQRLGVELAELRAQSRRYAELAVLDARGRVIVSTGGAESARPPIDRACFQQALDGGCLLPPRYDASLGQVMAVAAEPMADPQAQTIGIVVGYAGLAGLQPILAEAGDLGNTGVTYLLGAEHTILTAGRLPQAAPSGADAAMSARASAVALAGLPSRAGFYTNDRGVRVLGVYRWLPKLQAALLSEQDQSEAFQSSTAQLDLHVGVMLILLATAAVTALSMVRSITASLGQLALTAEQIANGRLDLAADIGQDDEIGALARSFNRMTARLRHARDQLEQRVRQRTEELALANVDLQVENAVRRQAEQAVQAERNKLKSILNAMDDGVYIVNQRFDIEYANPALEREFGPIRGRKCYAYLHNRAEQCPWCPMESMWQGRSVRWEHTFEQGGKTYELFETPLRNADGSLAKLAIFHDVTVRKRAEDETLQRNQELAILSRRLVEIQESERHYISRELHDETGQALTSLMLRLGMLERDIHSGMPVVDRVAELKHTVEEVLESLHALAVDLRPSSLDHVGLAPALRQYAERMAERHGLIVDFGMIGLDQERLLPEMEVTIYRIVQEALVNIVRHARASHADVIIERRPQLVRVIVEDNGVGFDMASAMYAGRLGLLGMRERAEMLGGHLLIDSALGIGTTVVMEAPYAG